MTKTNSERQHERRNESTYICELCGLGFVSKFNLGRHVGRVHPGAQVADTGRKVRLQCPLCPLTAAYVPALHSHFADSHQIQVVTKEFEFTTKEEFLDWKTETELKTSSSFVQHGPPKGNGVTFHCHRSGRFQGLKTRKRALKASGSSKMNAFCPARMKAIFLLDGQVQVIFTQTHVGHSLDPRYLRTKSSVPETRSPPSSLTVLNAWLHKSNQSPLFHFTSKDQFILGFMVSSACLTSASSCIFLDLYPKNDCHLLVVSVPPARPSLFAVFNDFDLLPSFFNSVRERVGPVCSQVLLSHPSHLLISAWKDVMPAPHRTFYTTHGVRQDWSSYLSKEVEDEFAVLLSETDEKRFRVICFNFKQKLIADGDEFLAVFESRYLNSVELWANCFRDDLIRRYELTSENLRMTIEKFLNRRVDRVAEGILKLGQESTTDSVPEDTMRAIKERHDAALRMTDVTVTSHIVSWTFHPDQVTVKEVVQACNCPLICSVCDSCVHRFSCTCDDAVLGHMCRHVHYLLSCFLHSEEPRAEDEPQTENVRVEFILEESNEIDLDAVRRNIALQFNQLINSLHTKTELDQVQNALDSLSLEFNNNL